MEGWECSSLSPSTPEQNQITRSPQPVFGWGLIVFLVFLVFLVSLCLCVTPKVRVIKKLKIPGQEVVAGWGAGLPQDMPIAQV
jgi:hypothetical protein